MDIDEFLAAQKASGQVESEGVFTVAIEKARQKLGQFQLNDPSFYLLKVVQAAVQGGATRIDLRTSRKKLALWFDAPAPLFDFHALLEGLRNPLDAPEGPLKSLVLGFNASLFSEPPQVSLVWWGREASHAVVATGPEMAMTIAPERPAGVSDSDSLYMFSVNKNKPGWFENATAREHATVSTYCCYAAVDFRIDGRKLEAGLQIPPREDTLMTGYSQIFHLAERLEPDPTGRMRVRTPKPVGRLKGTSGWLRRGRSADTFCLQPALSRPASGEVTCQRAYALPLGLRGVDKIVLVCHGVKAATVSVNSNGAGAVAIANADHLAFDLSGFGVVRDEAYHGLVDEVNEVWRAMANDVVADLEHLTATVTEKESKATEERQKESLTCGCLGCCLTFMIAGSLPFPLLQGDLGLVVGVLGLAGGAYVPWLKKRPDPHHDLREVTRHRLAQLREHWPRG